MSKNPARFSMVLALYLTAVAAGVAENRFDLSNLLENQWVQVSAENTPAGYDYSTPVFVESRGQLLQWGGAWARYQIPLAARDDVRAFDSDAGQWTSDYPPTEHARPIPPGHGAPPLGVSYYGMGGISEAGAPYASALFGGGCYDTARDQLIYTMKGLMAAYKPTTKKWRDMGARTILYGKEYPGGPPAYAITACYDPVNDEIVAFPHWTGERDVQNTDLVDVSGHLSGHLGTFRYSFRDNTWRRVSETFGSKEQKTLRDRLLRILARAAHTSDLSYALHRSEETAKEEDVTVTLRAVRKDLEQLGLPDACKPDREAAAKELTNALARAERGEWLPTVLAIGRAVWILHENVLQGPLRVEPAARCGAPMVYDPEHKAIVMFGGHSGLVRSDIRPSRGLGSRPGVLNDTWVYHCRTRQWRELPTDRRPPGGQVPQMFYDPSSRRMILLTFERDSDGGGCTIWSLDVEVARWYSHGRIDWKWPLSRHSVYASNPPMHNVAFDPKARLVVFTENVVRALESEKKTCDLTCVMKFDLNRLPSKPAPPYEPDPPIRRQVLPANDPQWIKKIAALPANTWVEADPKRDSIGRRYPTRRDWGIAACDPIRGDVYYFGGGHATYQIRDVAIYAVGANHWVHAAGDHNDFLPPVGWGGAGIGYRGAPPASHQRNSYVALDGRMYTEHGAGTMRPEYADPAMAEPGPRFYHFYDVDWGGVWRRRRISTARRGPGVKGTYGRVHLAHPDGRVVGFGGRLEPYDGRKCPRGVATFASYDVDDNILTVKRILGEMPDWVPECRPFCLVPDRGTECSIFFYEWREGGGHRTWIYDMAENRFTNLNPGRQPPPGPPGTVLYLRGQQAVWAVIRHEDRGFRQWVYSFHRNAWAPLTTKGETPDFVGPYSQTVYSAKYGVLVNVRNPTRLMRPDVSGVSWE